MSCGWRSYTRCVTLWLEDVVPGTELRVVVGGKTQDVTLIISTELSAVKLAEATSALLRLDNNPSGAATF